MTKALVDQDKPRTVAPIVSPVPSGYVQFPTPEGFQATVGPFYSKRHDDGTITFGFPAEKRHANPNGVIHGGMLVTFIDHVLGFYVWRAIGDNKCATISLNCDFLSSARVGDWVQARGEITRQTRSVVFCRGELLCKDRVLLTAKGIWKVL